LNPDASKKTLVSMPDWYLNLPVNEGYKYVTATSTSRDMQVAVDKATLGASNKLAGQVKSEMNAVVDRVQKETGLGKDSDIIDVFTQTQEQIISTSLEGWKVSNKAIEVEKTDAGRIYRAYVMVEWDEGAAQKQLLAKIKGDKQLFDAMEASELLDNMEEKVQRYRERNQN